MSSRKATITVSRVNKEFLYQHQKTIKELVQALFFRQKIADKVKALNNVSFSVSQGETVGVIGKNGAGKSTLLKLLAGVSQPSSGTVTVSGKVAPLIELGAGFHPELTGRENIYLNGVILGLTEKYIDSQIKGIINFSELSEEHINSAVKYYSSGMYMRLAFSVAVFTQPDIFLVDEILSVGDIKFQKKCIDRMEEFKKRNVTIFLVSHSTQQVKNFCDRVIYLKQGKVAFDGDVEQGVDMYIKDNQS